MYLRITNKIKAYKSWLDILVILFLHRRAFSSHGYMKLLNREIALRKYSRDQLEKAEQFIDDHMTFLNPKQVENLSYAGPMNDGGYFFVNLFQAPILVSGGAGKNIDFELFFRNRGSEVFLFDGSIRSNFENLNGIKTIKKNLGKCNYSKTVSLSEFLHNHQIFKSANRSGIYLKLDIEGSEIDVLEDLLDYIHLFDQLIVEFHDLYKLGDPEFRRRLENLIQNIEVNFLSIYMKPNNWENFIQFGRSFTPNVFEITFLNLRHISNKPNYTEPSRMPAHLNNPNRLEMPDKLFKQN